MGVNGINGGGGINPYSSRISDEYNNALAQGGLNPTIPTEYASGFAAGGGVVPGDAQMTGYGSAAASARQASEGDNPIMDYSVLYRALGMESARRFTAKAIELGVDPKTMMKMKPAELAAIGLKAEEIAKLRAFNVGPVAPGRIATALGKAETYKPALSASASAAKSVLEKAGATTLAQDGKALITAVQGTETAQKVASASGTATRSILAATSSPGALLQKVGIAEDVQKGLKTVFDAQRAGGKFAGNVAAMNPVLSNTPKALTEAAKIGGTLAKEGGVIATAGNWFGKLNGFIGKIPGAKFILGRVLAPVAATMDTMKAMDTLKPESDASPLKKVLSVATAALSIAACVPVPPVMLIGGFGSIAAGLLRDNVQ